MVVMDIYTRRIIGFGVLFGVTPVEKTDGKIINTSQNQWERDCRGLFELPIAA